MIRELAVFIQWFCFRCGAEGSTFDHSGHDFIRRNTVIHEDNYIGPIYITGEGKAAIEQCTPSQTSEASGWQFILTLPKNWVPVPRYIIQPDTVCDADWVPVGASDAYVDCLLSGGPYVPEGSV